MVACLTHTTYTRTLSIPQVADRFPLLAASVQRLDSNFADDAAWLGKLARAGFNPRAKSIWVRACVAYVRSFVVSFGGCGTAFVRPPRVIYVHSPPTFLP